MSKKSSSQPSSCSKQRFKTFARSLAKPSLARRKSFQNRGPRRFWTPTCGQGAPLTSLETAKRGQDAPRRRPTGAQEDPGAAQERQKAGRGTPARGPNPTRSNPKTSFYRSLCGKLCLAGSWSDFVSFLGLRETSAICKKPAKT